MAEKYINDHNNHQPKKLESFGAKLFLTSSCDDEKNKDKCLAEIENSLKYERVDRRVARSRAEWLPDENLAKLTKITGATSGYGFQNKNGKFLNAEETLYLLEINKLELSYENVSLSIEEAFKNVKSLDKYLVFKQLNMNGFKLKTEQKRKIAVETEASASEPPLKIAKTSDDFLEKLRLNGPKTYKENSPLSRADYYINKTDTPLIICQEDHYSTKINEPNLCLYAVTSSDNISYYKFYNVDIPIL